MFRKPSLVSYISVLLLVGSLAFAQAPASSDSDAEFQRGIRLAKEGNSDQARQVLSEARRRFPSDKRFPIELAGLSFQSKNYPEAKNLLKQALTLDPHDEYATNFLASIYLLEGNLDAALLYWNRIGRPQVSDISFEPAPKTDPVLVDRTLTIAPASLLKLDAFKTSQARLQGLGVFAPVRYSLLPKADGEFDLSIRAQEKNGFGNTKLEALLRLFRGLPYQTLYPEYFNAGHRAVNITSLLRWDSDKQRASFAVSAPLKRNPSLRYAFSADFRDENWVLSPDTAAALPFHSQQFSFAVALKQVVSGKWNWQSGASVNHDSAPLLTVPDLFARGYSLQYFAGIERKLLDDPEHRVSLTARLTPTIGRNFGDSSSSFARLQSAVDLSWLPGRKVGDYEFTSRLSGGGSWGTLPFSNLFMLGAERDNDLLLRGHVGTRDGRKGSAPMARDYLLANLEFTRRVFNNGFVDLRLGPFLDIGRPYRTLNSQSSERWLYDPGLALKVRILGAATFTLTYGRNLHEHRNAFYVSALQ
ncbi:MAG TPA: tetratricopeptide repeat protein [Terriglobales bacterium]|nr:tetratricopeptide repeat protein [Terriglobales bacterium]